VSILASAARVPPVPVATGREVVVSIRGLTKRFPVARTWAESIRAPGRREWVTVVDNVDLDVVRGEFFGLLGPNGAGKTTLFKMLSTLVLPDSGAATVEGLDIERDAKRIRTVLVPVVPEERSVNWRLSARENLAVYAALHGFRGRALWDRVDQLLAVVELDDAGHKMVGRFSSGMRQRLLLARTLLGKPKVLLLDEPTRSLDPVSARRFRQFLREEIAGKQGCTVLLATHNAEEALELCDRVGVLHRGRLLAVGQAEDLSRRLGDPRYRLLTRRPVPPAVERLFRQDDGAGPRTSPPDPDGWVTVEFAIPGGNAEVAATVARLAAAGAEIARFERVSFALADLIEGIVESDGRDGQDV